MKQETLSDRVAPRGKPMPSPYALNFIVNGRAVTLKVEPTKPLVDILRNDLGLTGAKVSCEIGRCGACSVLLDGKLANACLIMAYQCAGKSVETIEGTSSTTAPDTIMRAFLEEGAFQCGYCTPGMIMAVKAVFRKNSRPSMEDLEEGLSGNLCRCTGYAGILRVMKRLSSRETD
ncbi:MAG TPA: 2Fe-2S iron-sulfur cluster binding domain-containing protein [Alicyclobacillus sp.]|nr:2Fe-2S iron-sulfur cluster binding domain-containing protein [Alicyclobacillus sp.]